MPQRQRIYAATAMPLRRQCKIKTWNSLFVAKTKPTWQRKPPYLSPNSATRWKTAYCECSLFVAIRIPTPPPHSQRQRKTPISVNKKSWKGKQLPYLSPTCSPFVANAKNMLPICRQHPPKVSQQCSQFVAPPSQSVANRWSKRLCISELRSSTNQWY